MPEPLKLMFSEAWVSLLVQRLEIFTSLDNTAFKQAVFSDVWPNLELKDRSKHIAMQFSVYLPGTYPEQLAILKKAAPEFNGFTAIVFSDFVELYGLDYWDESIKAMELFTQSCTAEFAVRPYLIADYSKMIRQFEKWSKSKNEHIRRLSSEGIRSRLPWGKGVPQLKKDPDRIIQIISILILDESEYVRRSVANNLNDISKDYPEKVIQFIQTLDLSNVQTARLAKHALRTLLKKAHPKALQLFGFDSAIEIVNPELILKKSSLTIGEIQPWTFSFNIKGEGLLRLEYKMHFYRPSGLYSQKVFQIRESKVKNAQSLKIEKNHSFKNLTTRKHYPGLHKIEIIANGKSILIKEFQLLD